MLNGALALTHCYAYPLFRLQGLKDVVSSATENAMKREGSHMVKPIFVHGALENGELSKKANVKWGVITCSSACGAGPDASSDRCSLCGRARAGDLPVEVAIAMVSIAITASAQHLEKDEAELMAIAQQVEDSIEVVNSDDEKGTVSFAKMEALENMPKEKKLKIMRMVSARCRPDSQSTSRCIMFGYYVEPTALYLKCAHTVMGCALCDACISEMLKSAVSVRYDTHLMTTSRSQVQLLNLNFLIMCHVCFRIVKRLRMATLHEQFREIKSYKTPTYNVLCIATSLFILLDMDDLEHYIGKLHRMPKEGSSDLKPLWTFIRSKMDINGLLRAMGTLGTPDKDRARAVNDILRDISHTDARQASRAVCELRKCCIVKAGLSSLEAMASEQAR